MSPEPGSVSGEIREDAFGSLGSCLVEGNSEQQVRARRLRRRALILSVLTQTIVLTLLVLAPLFGRTERMDLTRAVYMPPPPYGHHAHQSHGERRTPGDRRRIPDKAFVFHPPNLNAPIQQAGTTITDDGLADNGPTGAISADGPGCSGCIEGDPKQPEPPQPVRETPAKSLILKVAHIDPGMLVYRVEPRYPPLAIQTHREGRVELRAMIATDGTIESLQIVVSDPLFNQSAREAVQQWRYRPTMLNGQAVRVDTYITVFYKMQR